MKNNFKTMTAAALALVLCLGLLVGCGAAKVKNDVPVSDLASALRTAVGMEDSLVSMDGTFLGLMGKKSGDLGEYEILVSNGTTIDELGVFKAGTLTTDQLKKLTEDYLAVYREKRWPMVELYNPDEEPKLSDAEIKVLGDYVVYLILGEADRAKAGEALEKALKG